MDPESLEMRYLWILINDKIKFSIINKRGVLSMILEHINDIFLTDLPYL